jgi:hypothetical protein
MSRATSDVTLLMDEHLPLRYRTDTVLLCYSRNYLHALWDVLMIILPLKQWSQSMLPRKNCVPPMKLSNCSWVVITEGQVCESNCATMH